MARLLGGVAFLAAFVFSQAASVRLAELDISAMTSGWRGPRVNLGVGGEPLAVGGKSFDDGIGTHAPSSWKLSLAGKATEFRALVGVNDGSPGTVEFIVRGDEKDLFRSGALRGGDAAKPVQVNLHGVQQLELCVEALGDNTSDHADWINPVIVHNGSPLPAMRPLSAEAKLIPDLPGEPPNAGTQIEWDEESGALRLKYDGKVLLNGHARGAKLSSAISHKNQAATQTITLTGSRLKFEGEAYGSCETIAAENEGEAQKIFPLVRTCNGGPSRNLRNNTIYDRQRDWQLSGPDGRTRLEPAAGAGFKLVCTGDLIELTFKPRFYQRHKNIGQFRPWTYEVRKDSITGWCSWWAFMRHCTQKDCDELLAVWREKHLADYGYRFIQLDDCFQNEFGKGQGREPYPGADRWGYVARGPETWLDWRKDNFPSGADGYATACRDAGFEPGIWIGTFFTDKETITRHPEWFIRDKSGKPFIASWSCCGVDATNEDALNALVRPTFAGLRTKGFSYVKIDQLRHYFYDNLNRNQGYCWEHKVSAEEMFRNYLGAARKELGPETFILSCWGVLPESVGIADACRIGGDGYGPVTMQQYNSWNGIVWRNDPDHCDILPHFKPAEAGNVKATAKVEGVPADTIIRPALASIAGCLLMLSDKPGVYRDDANLEGIRRSAPVLFSVPGQLYDFDPSKSRNLLITTRASITNGANPSPVDADQFGPVCPWWLNEFSRPFEHWNVLHRLNWKNSAAEKTELHFSDLGLDPKAAYLVHEFWSHKFLGIFRGSVELPAQPPMGISSYALREKLDRPQIVSTSRHLSQGGMDLIDLRWNGKVLYGRSNVVIGDPYEVTLLVPPTYRLIESQFNGNPADVSRDGEIVRVKFTPSATGTASWTVRFE